MDSAQSPFLANQGAVDLQSAGVVFLEQDGSLVPMKSPSSPTAQPQATILPAYRADPVLVVNKKEESLHMLLAGNMEDLCSPAWGCNRAQGQEWAFWSPLGWIACPAGLFCLIPGRRVLAISMTVLCGQSKPAFPLCSTVCSTGLGKRTVNGSASEPNIGLHLPHKSLQLTCE